jgi:hypothetical protein
LSNQKRAAVVAEGAVSVLSCARATVTRTASTICCGGPLTNRAQGTLACVAPLRVWV